MTEKKATPPTVGMTDYDEAFIKHEFKRAARGLKLNISHDMSAPVEIRKEGTFTAVSRLLFYPGEQTGHPKHANGVAPSIYEQFKMEFEALQPKAIAFHSAVEHKSYNLETEVYEVRWAFRYAYVK